MSDAPAEFSLIARHFRPLAGPGALDLLDDAAVFVPPPGQEADDRYGPSTRLVVSGDLVLEGAGTGTPLTRRLVLAEGEGVLSVAATAASCDVGVEHLHEGVEVAVA